MMPLDHMPIIDGPGIIPTGPPPSPKPARIAVGLYNRNGAPNATSAWTGWAGKNIRGNYVKGMIVNGQENLFQPDFPGQTFPANNAVDQALTQAASYGLQLKVRVALNSSLPYGWFVGSSQTPPDAWWGYHLGEAVPGSPVLQWDESQDGNVFPAGRFWKSEVVEATRLFIQQFGTKYNGTAVADLAVSGAMVRYPEPCLRQLSTANNVQYVAEGYTLALDLAANYAAIDAHAQYLTMTSSLALNPYQNPAANKGNLVPEMTAFAAYAKTKLGNFLHLGNNSDRYDNPAGVRWPCSPSAPNCPYDQMYDLLTVYGHDGTTPIYIQTATPKRVWNLYQTCLKAISYGATMVELPGSAYSSGGSVAEATTGYTDTNSTGPYGAFGMSPSQFDEINAGLASNALALGYDANGVLI